MGKKLLVGVAVVVVIAVFLFLNYFYKDFPLKVDIPWITPPVGESKEIKNCEEDLACFNTALSHNCDRVLFVLPYPGLPENETYHLVGRIEGPVGEACNVTISDPTSGGTMTCTISGRLMRFINSFDSLGNYCEGSLLTQIMADVRE